MNKNLVRTLKVLVLTFVMITMSSFLLLLLDGKAKEIKMTPAERAKIHPTKEYSPLIDSARYHDLYQKFGKNKRFPEQYIWPCLLALSHYPELKETPINFEVRPAFVPLYSWPRPVSVLFPWINRSYNVVISTQSEDSFEPILFHNLPFNDQVGIIGHELAHTVFYQNKTSLQTVVTAWRYQFNRTFQNELEREADQMAIAHGLGYQLYDYAFFVRKAFGRSLQQIVTEKENTYLSPPEIAQAMSQYTFYTLTLDSPESYFD